MPPQPPAKKKRPPLWAFLVSFGIVLVVLFACIAASRAGAPTTNTSDNNGTLATTVPTQANVTPTSAAPKTFKVGDVVKAGDWEVKVNSVKTSKGGEFDTLKSGNIFLEISVSEKNVSSEKKTASSLLSWKMRDEDGQEYTLTFISDAPTSPDGDVNAGSSIKGTLVYEVPKSLKKFRLEFTPDLLSDQLVTWELSA